MDQADIGGDPIARFQQHDIGQLQFVTVNASTIGRFVSDHPTIKMLALSFLTLVGFALMAEGVTTLEVKSGYGLERVADRNRQA